MFKKMKEAFWRGFREGQQARAQLERSLVSKDLEDAVMALRTRLVQRDAKVQELSERGFSDPEIRAYFEQEVS